MYGYLMELLYILVVLIFCCFFFFFFSSRRRHTRWNCDWSSDVCSSDLLDHHADRHDQEVLGQGRQRRGVGRVTEDPGGEVRSEEHTSELQSQFHLVCRLLLEKKKKKKERTKHKYVS